MGSIEVTFLRAVSVQVIHHIHIPHSSRNNLKMQQQTVILGIRGYKLANKDIFSKSDPYIVISKQVNSGGYTPIRTSETIKNDLNPIWRNFTLYENELPTGNDKFRLEVYDDDGKLGRDTSDESIGVGYFSLEDLEQSY